MVKKCIEIGRFRTRVVIKPFSPFLPTIIEFILVMFPGSAIREKLLAQSLFLDTRTDRKKVQAAVFLVHIGTDVSIRI